MVLEVAKATVRETLDEPPTWYRARAMATYAIALMAAHRNDDARDWASRAREAARAAGSASVEADALATIGQLALRSGSSDEAISPLVLHLNRARRPGHRPRLRPQAPPLDPAPARPRRPEPRRTLPRRAGPRRPPAGRDDLRMTRLAALLAGLNAIPEPIARDACDHAHREDRYTPSRKLKHLVRARTNRCCAPGCGAQAITSEIDHTIPHPAGPSCQCNLGPACKRHHHAKHAPGWHLQQPRPGVMRWTTPSGRTYTTHPTQYDE